MPPCAPRLRRLPRLVESGEFERGLRARSLAASAHFAIYHVEAPPATARPRPPPLRSAELSTIRARVSAQPVEDFPASDLPAAPIRIGAVVPKRHARRAVTRSMLKRQIYAAAERQRDRLAPGLWIVRLRAPFDRALFVSAASSALRIAARSELDALLEQAAASPRPSALP